MWRYVCVVLLIVAVVGAEMITLEGIIRDQAPQEIQSRAGGTVGDKANCNNGNCVGFYDTDFEYEHIISLKGIVGLQCEGWFDTGACAKINTTDRTPILSIVPNAPVNGIHSTTSFYRWFHDAPTNFKVNYTIPLTLDTGSGNYVFSNSAFFPIDGRGWGDSVLGHNFAFCMEAHMRFGYSGKEVFEFTGDDDVFVFINDYLVIDLGGVHGAQSQRIELDKLARVIGLTPNNNYRMDFFYCERHTSESNCKISTNMDFYCSYNDWCGICEGSGQSCCDSSVINTYCNDNNACTLDTCVGGQMNPKTDPSTGCLHTPITCTPPTNPCMEVKCDTSRGCVYTNKTCNDNDPCTIDTCSNGQCFFDPITCNDNNKCTTDQCVGGVCQHVNTTSDCIRSNKCFNYFCDPLNGCGRTAKSCNDNNACTNDTCNPDTGCANPTINCSDGDLCTEDKCDTRTGCYNPTITCSSTDLCVAPTCEKTKGCLYPNTTCNPGDVCNTPYCDSDSGCGLTSVSCDDHSVCTVDSCNVASGGCVNTQISCSDSNACTEDLCNSQSGCYNPRINCDDGNECTIDYCDTITGCMNVTRDCDDSDACTVDDCDRDTGCSFKPLTCDDGDECTIDTCDKNVGCKNEPIADCIRCSSTAEPCVTTDSCNPIVCDPVAGQCTNGTKMTCNDGNLCTADICNDGVCSNPRINCAGSGDLCVAVTCDPAVGCVYTNKTCNDNNPCTTDYCENGECKFVQTSLHCLACNATKACEWTDPCNPFTCDASFQCVANPRICNDSNFCTSDRCVASVDKKTASCSYTRIENPCPTTDWCNPWTCVPATGCAQTQKVCNDNNQCTTDTCVSNSTLKEGQCVFSPVVCEYEDECNPKTCVAGNCVAKPVDCDDHNMCTTDSCSAVSGAAVCSHATQDCSDPCRPTACNVATGQCYNTTAGYSCDDRNPCTDDVARCNGDGTSTCTSTNIVGLCDDANVCTNDFCNSTSMAGTPCYHQNITCPAPSLCQVAAGCDSVNGCQYANKTCDTSGDWCKIGTCDNVAGCIFVNRVCPPTEDDNCYVNVCNSGTSACEVKQKESWAKLTSKKGVLCPLAYDSTAKAAAIGAGAAAGIAIGAVAGAAALGYGSKRAYDYYKTMDSGMASVSSNPLYEASDLEGVSPIYENKE